MIYKRYIKRFFAIILSFIAIIGLSWLFLIIAIVIKVTSRGPILFKQKRIGKDKTYFNILKFRTMRIDTPKDMPTHMLENPEQYITAIGKFLRKTSLDELPQLFNILVGQMAIVGPRPALWNQDDLIEERDKYGANSIRPGLTGLAQISGRDELAISVKAKFDGEYVEQLSLKTDIMLILRTVGTVLRHDGVKEGKSNDMNEGVLEIASTKEMRDGKESVLIIGANSYIGKHLKIYLQDKMNVDMVSASNSDWEKVDLSLYTTIIHLAAIVHKKEVAGMEDLYQKVNCDLPVQVANKAKAAGVRQFIFMSTAAVYGSKASVITKETLPSPDTMYGKSKLEAENQLGKIAELGVFDVCIIRPPMVYGEGCKGNYPRLKKLAKYTLFFPRVHNKRSMISIERLCETIFDIIVRSKTGVILPQDEEYVDTCLLVRQMRSEMGKRTILVPGFGWLIHILIKISPVFKKVFGDMYYEAE